MFATETEKGKLQSVGCSQWRLSGEVAIVVGAIEELW